MPCKRVCAAAALALLTLAAAHAAGEPQTLPLGAAAPDFALPGVDGKTWRLADFDEADILVVVFTCNHCPTAQAYEARMQKLADDYRDKGVVLVAISPNDNQALRLDELGYTDVDDSLEAMKLRAQERKFTFPYLYDGDTQKVSRAYGPVSTPHVFIFDRQRKLRYVGRVDDSEKPAKVTAHDARNAIAALLAGRPVPVGKTKTFGCSIKWADKRGTVAETRAHWANEPVELTAIDQAQLGKLAHNDSQKLRLINVWATWCAPCVEEFPELVAIHHMYRHRDFELVTVSADSAEDHARALEFLKKQQASSTNYRFSSEDQYALVEALDKTWEGPLPYTLLVAPGGKVLYRKQGLNDPLELRRAIVEYLGRVYK